MECVQGKEIFLFAALLLKVLQYSFMAEAFPVLSFYQGSTVESSKQTATGV